MREAILVHCRVCGHEVLAHDEDTMNDCEHGRSDQEYLGVLVDNGHDE